MASKPKRRTDLDDDGRQATVENVGLLQLAFEVGGASKNDAFDVGLVSGDEKLERGRIMGEGTAGGVGKKQQQHTTKNKKTKKSGVAHLCRHFSHLAHVVLALLETKTRKTQCGLTTTAVLLGQVDAELVQDVAGVAAQCAVQRAVA